MATNADISNAKTLIKQAPHVADIHLQVLLAFGGIALLVILLDVAPKLGGWVLLLVVIVMLINAKKQGAI